MPLYLVSSKTALSTPIKKRIADCIVASHCSLTQAPKTYVNVLFSEGFPLRTQHDIDVLGIVRKGRNLRLNQTLEAEVHTQVASQAGIAPHQLHVTLLEVPATWVMEDGIIMPEPGEEPRSRV